MKRTTIHCCSKDRHSELALMLQSLRTQTIQDWDLLLLDESKTPITQNYFLVALINRIKLEGHCVRILRNELSQGVCYSRNKLIESDISNNDYVLRLDDDIILEPDYIQKLLNVINKGFDMASGVIPLVSMPQIKREVSFVMPIINKHELDNEGNLILQKDDCGFGYIEEEIIPTHQFRTNCLYKTEINKKVSYPLNLSHTGFREEGFFSVKAIVEGYTIGVNTHAICYHLACPSGGVRANQQLYSQNVQLDDNTFKQYIKDLFLKHGDFFSTYNLKVIK